MDNYQITKKEIIIYLSDSKNIEDDERVKSWMDVDDKSNISLTEVINIIWKIIV